MTGANDHPEIILLDPGQPARTERHAVDGITDGPPIACIMPTRGRMIPARHAIACFLAQSYARRELIVTCATPDSEVERHVRTLGDPRIRFVDPGGVSSVGELRNAAIAAAACDLICLWDDDDLYRADRLALQYAAFVAAGAKASLLVREILWWPERARAALSPWRIWENSLLTDRRITPPFGNRPGLDTAVMRGLRASQRLVLIDRPDTYCYVTHGSNLWGEQHFEMLFANASESRDGSAYAATVAELSETMPLAAYAADLAAATSGG